MSRSLYLFDIDGTLITSGGVGMLAMERAFDTLHGSAAALSSVPFAGMTDPAIVRAGLEASGQQATDEQIDATLDRYVAELGGAIADKPLVRVLDGVFEILDALEAREQAALGLGTGNLEAGARAKLTPVNLFERFSFGGFGSDHELRHRVLECGRDRGFQRHGWTERDCRVVVIGDTPADIAAAKALGAECLAVATGPFAVEELATHEPTLVVETLGHPEALDFLR